jgi:hypothetical protein
MQYILGDHTVQIFSKGWRCRLHFQLKYDRIANGYHTNGWKVTTVGRLDESWNDVHQIAATQRVSVVLPSTGRTADANRRRLVQSSNEDLTY